MPLSASLRLSRFSHGASGLVTNDDGLASREKFELKINPVANTKKMKVTELDQDSFHVVQNNCDNASDTEVPSSMDLIVPYSGNKVSTNIASDVNGVHDSSADKKRITDANIYKPLSSFGNYSRCNKDNRSVSGQVGEGSSNYFRYTGATDIPPSKLPIKIRNTSHVPRSKSISDVIVEEECEHHDTDDSNETSDKLDNRRSRSSDELMDTGSSPSPTTSTGGDNAEPIYFSIQKTSSHKSESPDSSDMDSEPIYFTIPTNEGESKRGVNASEGTQNNTSSRSRVYGNRNYNLNVRKNNMLNGNSGGNVGSTVAIICKTRDNINDMKEISNELTSTFKPVETSM